MVFQVNKSLSNQKIDRVKGKGVDYYGCQFVGKDKVIMLQLGALVAREEFTQHMFVCKDIGTGGRSSWDTQDDRG